MSFEEYLAAPYLQCLKVEGSFTHRAADLAGEPAWREVIRFLGEYLCHDRDGDIDLAQTLLGRLCPERIPADDPAWWRVWLAGELLPALHQEAVGEELDKALEKCIVTLDGTSLTEVGGRVTMTSCNSEGEPCLISTYSWEMFGSP